MIARRLFVLGAAALALSACGNLLGPPDAGQMFRVRPDFPQGNGEKVAWSLAVLRPDIAGGLDTDRIALLQPDGSMDYYANATYPDRLAPTVQHALVDAFEASGRIGAVAREEEALHADYNLLVEVKSFEARYAVQDGIPTAQVTLSAKLATAHGRKILATMAVTRTVPAGVNSAGAAVTALKDALAAAVGDIVTWTLNTAPAVPPGQSAETPAPGKPAEQLLHDLSRGRTAPDSPAR